MDIDEMITARWLTTADERESMRSDPLYAAHVHMLGRLCRHAEEAMRAEGLSDTLQERVLYRMVFGEACPGTDVDLIEAGDRARSRDRAQLDVLAQVTWASEDARAQLGLAPREPR